MVAQIVIVYPIKCSLLNTPLQPQFYLNWNAEYASWNLIDDEQDTDTF